MSIDLIENWFICWYFMFNILNLFNMWLFETCNEIFESSNNILFIKISWIEYSLEVFGNTYSNNSNICPNTALCPHGYLHQPLWTGAPFCTYYASVSQSQMIGGYTSRLLHRNHANCKFCQPNSQFCQSNSK